MCLVRHRIGVYEIVLVVIEEFLRMVHEECPGQHLLRRIAVILHSVIKPRFRTEVRYVAFRRYASASEEHDFLTFIYYIPYSFIHLIHLCFRLWFSVVCLPQDSLRIRISGSIIVCPVFPAFASSDTWLSAIVCRILPEAVQADCFRILIIIQALEDNK